VLVVAVGAVIGFTAMSNSPGARTEKLMQSFWNSQYNTYHNPTNPFPADFWTNFPENTNPNATLSLPYLMVEASDHGSGDAWYYTFLNATAGISDISQIKTIVVVYEAPEVGPGYTYSGGGFSQTVDVWHDQVYYFDVPSNTFVHYDDIRASVPNEINASVTEIDVPEDTLFSTVKARLGVE
jgi:hypothetical protein